MSVDLATIAEMFEYSPGNHGLTEEVIYAQKPVSADSAVPVFGGGSSNELSSTFISEGASNNEGEKLQYFDGPCLILTKDGSAGLLTYKGTGERFTINHHACVLRVRDAWKKRLDPNWFALQYQRALFGVTTSKSDNRVFSTEWLSRLKFSIPDMPVQRRQLAVKNRLAIVIKTADEASAALSSVLSTAVYVEKSTAFYEGPVAPLFKVYGGNSGLTEEFVYNNRPLSLTDVVTLRSGATLRENEMGSVASGVTLPNGKALKVFSGPCLLLTRKGYAGCLTYLSDARFSHNDDAYVLVLNDAWEEKVNLQWFAANFATLFRGAVTSRADNATFNKEWLEKMIVRLPPRSKQDLLATQLVRWQSAIEALDVVRKRASELLVTTLEAA